MKKLFGYIFLIVGSLLSCLVVLYVLKEGFDVPELTGAYNLGYLVGQVIYVLGMIGIAAYLMILGNRWTKKRV